MKKTTLSEIKEKGAETFLAKTIECSNDHDYYLDQLLDGRYLISYAEFPKAIFPTLNKAKIAYKSLVQKATP